MSDQRNPLGDHAVRWLCGLEPNREGESPTFFEVGKDGVSKIEYRVDNLGDHGIAWFDIWFGDRVKHSMQARAVAEIRYAD